MVDPIKFVKEAVQDRLDLDIRLMFEQIDKDRPDLTMWQVADLVADNLKVTQVRVMAGLRRTRWTEEISEKTADPN